MVAKIIRLIPALSVIVLASCQTISPVTSDDDLLRNDPGAQETIPEEKVDPKLESVEEQTSTPVKPATQDKPAVEKAKPEEAINPERAPAMSAPEPTPEQVITRLQQEALQLQSEGRWPEAELKLERALRIDADKVDLYHQLATVRMGQERFAEAEQIALKGLTLTDQTPKYKASLWEVIAQCRSAQGNIKGAKQARQEMLKWLDD